jgi:hypothetical protein
MRALGISAMVVSVFTSPAAAAREPPAPPPIHDGASLDAAMLQYRFSLDEFAWYNPYMTGEPGTRVAPVETEETGAASGEPAAAPADRAADDARRQFLDHVWSDP